MPTKKPKSVAPAPSKTKEERALDFSLALLAQLVDNNVQDANKYWKLADNLTERLFAIMAAASTGNEQATLWLKAIEKILHPQKFELPRTKIDEIATRYETNPQLARGWEVTALMSHLSHVVEPRDKDRSSPSDPVVIRAKSTLEGSEEIIKEIVKITRSYWKRNSTLQSLAIRMYLDYLHREGITDDQATISERTLKRDLQAVRDWEESATEDELLTRGLCAGYSLSGGSMFWCLYSEGWKDRKKKITTRKGMTKKRTN